MSTASSASSVSSFYTENGVTRLNGSELMSGLDTQKLIEAMTAKTQSKIDKENSLEQIATWRREMYREVESLMQKFSDDYFSYASSTNILSSTFFASSDLVSSSSAVSATGRASDAGNVVINSVTQLAQAASFTSVNPSGTDSVIASGTLANTWSQVNVGGKSMTVGYGGKQYTLTLDDSVVLDDRASTAENLTAIADGLNRRIDADGDLKGKLKFSVNEDGTAVELASTDPEDAFTLSAAAGSSDFYTALGFAGTEESASGKIAGDTVRASGAEDLSQFNQTVSSSSYLELKVDGQTYRISLGDDVDLSGRTSGEDIADAVAAQFQKQIGADAALKDKDITVSGTGGAFAVSGAEITGGSGNLLQGLGLSDGDGDGVYAGGGSVSKTALLTTFYGLGEALNSSSLTFKLDGVTKTITFSDSEKDRYSTAEDLGQYLQTKLDAAFGSGKVAVSPDSQKLTFKTADDTSVLTVSSSSAAGVLGETGALRIRTGETNRLETTKTLRELAEELPGLQSGDGSYSLTVNGKSFTFSEDTELGTVLSTVNNDPDAGVNISYSQTTGRFRITADDTGAQGRISLYDESGNLAQTLFGESLSVQSGDFTPGEQTEASSYSFTIDGGTTVSFIIPEGSYTTIENLAAAAQTAIDDTGLKGKILVGVSTDGKHLTFDSTDGSSLTLQKGTGGNILNLGDDPVTATGYTAGQDLNMKATLNGESKDITRSTNSFDLDGLHLTVTGTVAEGSAPVTFSSSGDVDDLVTKISDFVDEYNKLIEKANQYTSEMPYGLDAESGTNTKYGPLTEAQKKEMTDDEIEKWTEKAKQGLLQNDNTLNSILSDMRGAVLGKIESAGLSLSDIGISTTADVLSGGQLAVDKTKLKSALQSDPDRVSALFTNTDGVSAKIKQVIEKNIGAFGNSGALISVAGKDNMTGADDSQLSRQISGYESNIKKLQAQLQTEKSRWLEKFTTMETKLSALTSQYDYLSSVLMGGGSNS